MEHVRGALANSPKRFQDVRGTSGKFAENVEANLRGPLYANLPQRFQQPMQIRLNVFQHPMQISVKVYSSDANLPKLFQQPMQICIKVFRDRVFSERIFVFEALDANLRKVNAKKHQKMATRWKNIEKCNLDAHLMIL